jgi:uncharacterized secreted protein with C-terminal beta-propeller domain
VISEFDMGEGQVPKKVKRHILSSAFSAATNDIHCFGPTPVSVGIVGREEGYVN